MLTRVLPILITVPFDGENAAANRKRFMKDLSLRLDCPPDEGAGFYGWLQYHAFEAIPSAPPTGMQLYNILQRELNLFPNYIEHQRNVNGMLLTSNPVKDLERMAGLPPPLPYSATVETSDEYGQLHWECYRGRLAIIADDPTMHTGKKSSSMIGQVDMMTVVIIEVDEYDLTKDKGKGGEINTPHAGHVCAAKLFQQSPQWCMERGIQAMRVNADTVSDNLACIEMGEMWFYEMAEAAESDMAGTEHDDDGSPLLDYSTTTCLR